MATTEKIGECACNGETKSTLFCSFCGRGNEHVRQMIHAGNKDGLCICSDCVDLCCVAIHGNSWQRELLEEIRAVRLAIEALPNGKIAIGTVNVATAASSERHEIAITLPDFYTSDSEESFRQDLAALLEKYSAQESGEVEQHDSGEKS